MDELREEYKNILDSLELDESVIKSLKRCIDKYEGEDFGELGFFIIDFVEFMTNYKIIKTKAEGFKKLAETKEEYENIFKDLSARYKAALQVPYDVDVPLIDGADNENATAQVDTISQEQPDNKPNRVNNLF